MSFFNIPDLGRDPTKPPRYFVASPDDEDGNYGINAVFDNKADAVAEIAEFADTLYQFLLVEVLDATTETSSTADDFWDRLEVSLEFVRDGGSDKCLRSMMAEYDGLADRLAFDMARDVTRWAMWQLAENLIGKVR